MSLTLLPAPAPVRERLAPPQKVSRRDRRRMKKEQARARQQLAACAELDQIRAILSAAQAVVAAGWVQHAWFQYRDRDGELRLVTARNLNALAGHPVTGACLVGAIVHAAGGPGSIRSQPVNRALELTWHALERPAATEQVDWSPAPAVRTLRVRDLTRWNDDPSRTARQVEGLLVAAEERATAELRSLSKS